MIEAKLSLPRKFYYLPAVQDLSITDLTLSVYNNAGTAISGSPFSTTVMSGPTSTYQTAAVTFPAIGSYYYIWESPMESIKEMGQITVLDAPNGDVGIAVPRKYRYSAPSFSTGIGDIVLDIYDGTGTVISGSPFSTSETATTGVYETDNDITLVSTDTYLFYWSSVGQGYTYAKIEVYLALPDAGLRAVTFYLIDTEASPQDPLENVDVLLSETDTTPLQQTRTDGNGKAVFSAQDGDYVISVRKSGTTYNKNNLKVTVDDPADATNVNMNVFYLYVNTPFAATFDPTPPLVTTDKSIGSVDLVDMHGEPIVGATILISNDYVPTTKVGTSGKKVAVLGPPVCITTNGLGHAEATLIRGTNITVAFEGTTVRRQITVPDSATFDIISVLTSAGDPFDIVTPQIAAAVRRT